MGTQTVQTPARETVITAAEEWQLWRSSCDMTQELGLKKYFAMINCIHTTSSALYICFQTVALYGCKSVNGYDTKNLQMSSFWTKLYRHKVRFTHEVVFNIHNSHIWMWDNPQAKAHEHQDRFSVDSWVGIMNDTVVALYLLPDRLTDQYNYFLETMLLGCLKVCLSVRQQFYFNLTVGKMSSSGKMTYPERCNGCEGPTAWPPQLYNSIQEIFSCGDTWWSTLHSPSHDYQRSRVKTLGSCDNGWCQCIVVCSRECFAVQDCLSWNEWRSLWTSTAATKASTIWSFDSLCHLMDTCIAKLNVSGCYLVTRNYTTEDFCMTGILGHTNTCTNTEKLYVIT
jgi:hypothetical protein